MSIQLNHTIVWCRDKRISANFLTDILDLPQAEAFSSFLVVTLENQVSLDFCETPPPIASQHYAFLVSEPEFDLIFERIRQRGLDYWADPMKQAPAQINRRDGGRGLYFDDPDGHILEVLTRPYGSGGPWVA